MLKYVLTICLIISTMHVVSSLTPDDMPMLLEIQGMIQAASFDPYTQNDVRAYLYWFFERLNTENEYGTTEEICNWYQNKYPEATSEVDNFMVHCLDRFSDYPKAASVDTPYVEPTYEGDMGY